MCLWVRRWCGCAPPWQVLELLAQAGLGPEATGESAAAALGMVVAVLFLLLSLPATLLPLMLAGSALAIWLRGATAWGWLRRKCSRHEPARSHASPRTLTALSRNRATVGVARGSSRQSAVAGGPR